MDHDKAARRALLVAKALKHHASVIHNPAPVMGNPPPPVARYGTMAPHLTQIAPVARAEGGEVEEHPDNWENVKIGKSTGVYQTFPSHVEISSIRTPLRHRGQGGAHAVMQHILAHADSVNKPVRLVASPLDARTRSDKLIKFYQKYGFNQTGEKANFVGDPWMERPAQSDQKLASGGLIDPAFTDADETAQMKYIQDPNLAMPANQVDQDIEGGAYADGGEVGQQTQVSPEQRAENLKKFNPLADKNGNPKILYHGTTGDFSKFSNAMAGSSTGAKSASFGHWFTDNPRVAQSYADYAATYAPVQKLLSMADAASRKGNWDTHDKYSLEAEKLDESFGDISNRQRGQNILPVHLSMKNPHVVDAQGGQFGDLEGGLTKHIQYAKAKGHDGLIVRNLNDAAGISNLPADHYMVFHPNQIKSATGNNGNFDPAEHDIRRADGGEVSPHPALGIPGVHIRTAEVGEPIFHGEK